MGLSKKKRREHKATRLASEGKQPCPFCDKGMPTAYGAPGVSLLRADGETLICSDCGTRDALEGGLKMPVSKFLARYGSHDIYDSDAVARKLLAWTGERAPWTPTKARDLRRALADDPRGGHVTAADNVRCIGGYQMADALARELIGFCSSKMGRGFLFDDCLRALRAAGR